MFPQETHPGKLFGEWLRARRQKKGLIARVFAGQIDLTPAKYAEVEFGIVKWLDHDKPAKAAEALDLSDHEREEMHAALTAAKGSPSLKFQELFTREELAPVRCSTRGNKQLTADEKELLLDAVFAELV
jgi:transcriptional regulator with XRE-family HTH domain